jgi:hypothetical protein
MAGATTCTCNLTWAANTESDLAGYEIYFGDQPGVYNHTDSPISVGTITSYKFPSGTLIPGVIYYYALKARDFSNNLSSLSVEVQGGLPPDTTVTIEQAVDQVDPTTGSPINFTVIFSEVREGPRKIDIVLSG